MLEFDVPFKVRFHDFWPNFEPHSFLLTRLISKQVNEQLEIIIDPNTGVDLEIWSVFTFKSWKAKARARAFASRSTSGLNDYNARAFRGHRTNFSTKSKKRLWYTGENLRPPVGIFDATCSFDVNDGIARNVFLPFWMTRINHGLNTRSSEIYPTLDELMSPRKYSSKKVSLCTFSSVQEPIRASHLMALAATEYFEEIGTFGKLHGKWVENKLNSASEYLFQLCNENDLYPNYVTEKLQEAFICGNIPIWSGLDFNKHFNSEAIVNITGLSFEEIGVKLRSISSEKLIDMYEKPILNHSPNLEAISQQLAEWVIDS